MRAAPGLAALVMLAACEGGGDPVEQALRETAAVNHSATVEDGQVSKAAETETAGPGWEGRPTQGDAAFRRAERSMHDKMASASGQTVDETYIAKMIEHHRGAVAMADVALAQSTDPEIRRMAQAVKDAQTREIAEMRAWKPAGE
ncbi:DUF305 domain-containing protein [Brevundimonas sp. M20]|uniref:DUF305 domain-containing protein n=1 Tax=Brevundimonas sp. M20 TaxID=2591463 RepID=UPI001146F347|nr:DUF305 domain-containing protein [Brevundimonas sp. M20]QDH72696.1 DUF305 domain-containing protein [Brevundimonas sp. M20]